MAGARLPSIYAANLRYGILQFHGRGVLDLKNTGGT
jgi:hypothetical protein